MNSLKPRAPFQALIMSEESRLGREPWANGTPLDRKGVLGIIRFGTGVSGEGHAADGR